jgi:hypothetical protein
MTFDAELRFEFMLARDLGMGSVATLRRRLSQREFMEWAQFYAWEQRDREREQRRAASRRGRH